MKAAENPFRSGEITRIRYDISREDLDVLATRVLDGKPCCSCILGPEGSGKTTLLEDLGSKLAQSCLPVRWYSLTLESTGAERRRAVKCMCRLDSHDICLLDGGEVLGWAAWLKIRRSVSMSRARLIVTLHRNRGLAVVHRTKPDWQTTQSLVASLAGHYMSPDLERIARKSFMNNKGNVREVFRACYLALMDGSTSRSC